MPSRALDVFSFLLSIPYSNTVQDFPVAPSLPCTHRWKTSNIYALFVARLRFCVHYCMDRDAVKKKTTLRAVF